MPRGLEPQLTRNPPALPYSACGALSAQDIQLLMTLMDFRPKPISVFSMMLPEDHVSPRESLSEIPEEGSLSDHTNDAQLCTELLKTLDGASPSHVDAAGSGQDASAAAEATEQPVPAQSRATLVTVNKAPAISGVSDGSSLEQACEQRGRDQDQVTETCGAQEKPDSNVTEPIQASQPVVVAVHAPESPAAEEADGVPTSSNSDASEGPQTGPINEGGQRRRAKKTVGFAPGVATQAAPISMLNEDLLTEQERSEMAAMLRENPTRPKGPKSVAHASDPSYIIEHEREERRRQLSSNLERFAVPLQRERYTGPGR